MGLDLLLFALLERWCELIGWQGSFSPEALVLGTVVSFAFGAAIAVAGVRVFRPVYAAVVFFTVTALLIVVLESVAPWNAVVTSVAVVGVFVAFFGLFTKRLAVCCLSAFGTAAILYAMTGWLLAAIAGGSAALAVSLFRPKEAYIAVSAVFGSALAASVMPSALLAIELFQPNALPATLASDMNGAAFWAVFIPLAVGGGVSQLSLAKHGLDPVFTQTLTMPSPASRRAVGNVEGEGAVEDRADAPASVESSEAMPDEASEAVFAMEASARDDEGPSLSKPSGALADVASEARSEQPSGGEGPVVCEPSASPVAFASASGSILRAEPFKPSFRKEIKYRITEQDFLRLLRVLDAYLEYDPHSGPAGYQVRSLYFDSLDDRDLYAKLDGTLEHKKIRMRTYDPQGDKFNLEYKCRWNQDGFKRKFKMDRDQAMRLVRNEYEVLREFESDPLANELYERMVRGRYVAKVIVEYHRTAWEYPASNIRVTWDQGIQASYFPESFFEESPLYIPVLPSNLGVLEIKYDHYFPSILKDALSSLDQLPVANSKYALGRTYV